eukprot:165022_1
MFQLFYSTTKALKVVDDEPIWNLDELRFSRIYGRKQSDCKYISGRMAHRLYLRGIIFSDELEETFLNGVFRDWDDETKIFIQKSYINYIMTAEFQTLLKHALNRVMSRLMKGFGFAANCIAERFLAFRLIGWAQDAFVDRTELYNFNKNFTFYQSWPIERVNELLDANFVIVMEKECNIKIDRQVNKEILNDILKDLMVKIDKEQKQ